MLPATASLEHKMTERHRFVCKRGRGRYGFRCVGHSVVMTSHGIESVHTARMSFVDRNKVFGGKRRRDANCGASHPAYLDLNDEFPMSRATKQGVLQSSMSGRRRDGWTARQVRSSRSGSCQTSSCRCGLRSHGRNGQPRKSCVCPAPTVHKTDFRKL